MADADDTETDSPAATEVVEAVAPPTKADAETETEAETESAAEITVAAGPFEPDAEAGPEAEPAANPEANPEANGEADPAVDRSAGFEVPDEADADKVVSVENAAGVEDEGGTRPDDSGPADLARSRTPGRHAGPPLSLRRELLLAATSAPSRARHVGEFRDERADVAESGDSGRTDPQAA